MASKFTTFEDDILAMVLAGKSYAAIAKFLVEDKGCKADGPGVYRWLKSRQRKLLARQALVHPVAGQVAMSQGAGGAPPATGASAAIPLAAPPKPHSQAPQGHASAAAEFDKLMLKTTEQKSILTKTK